MDYAVAVVRYILTCFGTDITLPLESIVTGVSSAKKSTLQTFQRHLLSSDARQVFSGMFLFKCAALCVLCKQRNSRHFIS